VPIFEYSSAVDEVDRVLWVLVQLQHAGWGVAHLSTCTSPLFPHSLFTSSLPQTFHPLLLRTIEGPGRSPVCSRLVVVNVEASARTCLSCFGVTEDLPPFALVKLIAPSTNFLKSCIYFDIHYIWIATLGGVGHCYAWHVRVLSLCFDIFTTTHVPLPPSPIIIFCLKLNSCIHHQ
jgi:hypothetical protein